MMINIFKFSAEMGTYLINPISNCAYPGKLNEFKEESFWEGPVDKSVQVYGEIRRLTLIASAAYRSETALKVLNICFPNLYGPGDHKDPKRAHALGALTNKFVNAVANNSEEVSVWGTGSPIREWLFIDDAVNAISRSIALELEYDLLNIGCGKGISISDLVIILAKRTGFEGKIVFDKSKPDGDPLKIMNSDISKEILGWSPTTSLQDGIDKTIAWYQLS
jgi:GDP-L-fucose synthase